MTAPINEQHQRTSDEHKIAVAHRLEERVALFSMAPPRRHARRVNGHDGQG